jgi:predicted permease
MTLGSAIIFIIVLLIVASIAYWLITKFLTGPEQRWALIIAGVVCLFALAYKFAPALMQTHI